ncbi:UNVERIFIED_CONTAM: hypothetical protein Sradi_0192900 [Sesamum radiatum]|uniref:Endonuclease/exonuclease/phosphatase domain-containing protein n=1 Tax=Sesamum radiatum TaxID=300843 RepID=A0AAW2W3Z0_SESRA
MAKMYSPIWWHFTGLYGEPDVAQRRKTWNLFARLHDQSRRPWICAGDFNEILDPSEKLGGPPRPIWQIRNFRNALEHCGLVDVCFTGSPFTWCNRHKEPDTVYERLDRACSNSAWSQLFPNVSVQHVFVNCSDHTTLSIQLADRPTYAARSVRPWRFEAAWLQSSQCESVVERGWVSGLGSHRDLGVAAQIERCKSVLQLWSTTVFRGSKSRVHYLEQKLTRLLNGCITPEAHLEIAAIRKELEEGLRATRQLGSSVVRSYGFAKGTVTQGFP